MGDQKKNKPGRQSRILSVALQIQVLAVLSLQAGNTSHGDEPTVLPQTPSVVRSEDSAMDPSHPFDQRPDDKLARERTPRGDCYHAGFLDSQFDHSVLIPSGFRTLYGLQLFRPESRGLRVTIPYHQGRCKSSLAVLPMMTLAGDFEILATYELLSVEPPRTGEGAGANLYILAVNSKNSASLRRCVTTQGENAFWIHATTHEDGKASRLTKYFPALTSGGSMSLRRKRTVLQFLVAEEGDESLQVLHSVEFGEEVVGLVRVEVTTNGSDTTVDNLWKSFDLEADTLNRVPIPLFYTR